MLLWRTGRLRQALGTFLERRGGAWLGSEGRWHGFQIHAQWHDTPQESTRLRLWVGNHRAPCLWKRLLSVTTSADDNWPSLQGHMEASQILRGKVGWGHVKSMHLYEGIWAERKKITPRRIFFNRPNLGTTYTDTTHKDYLGTRAWDRAMGMEIGCSWSSNTVSVAVHKFFLRELTSKYNSCSPLSYKW